MIYRIRYRRTDVSCDAETVVEANSPAEAMVKFQHTHDGRLASSGQSLQDFVTSVRAEDDCSLFEL